MAQRQFRSDDTSIWADRYGSGGDGAYAPSTGTNAPTDSACTGTATESSLTATNVGFAIGQIILIHQTQGTGAGNWELNKIAGYTAGTITTSYPLINTYGTGAQVQVLGQYSSALIDTGVTVTGKAWNGTVGGIFALMCNGTTTVTGAITTTGKGYRGASSVTGNFSQGKRGEGHNNGTYNDEFQAANGQGGGGGRGADNNPYCAGGGGGGYATAGDNGASTGPGIGGSANATTGLTAIRLGGGGGSGGSTQQTASGTGSIGGGIVMIFTKSLVQTGTINADGNAGGTTARADCGGGGGGAGGSILIKGQNINVGTNKLGAYLGAGGAAGGEATRKGGNGSNGIIQIDYSGSFDGSTIYPSLTSTQDATLADPPSTPSGSFQFI